MKSPRTGLARRSLVRRRAAWAALAIGWLLPSAGCQVEYAGMTLPSGKYMHDDVQYFAPGTDFPWANTQAATQRARMQAMGMDVGGAGPLVVPTPPGAEPAVQNRLGRPTDINAGGLPPQGPPPGGAVPVVPGPGAVPPPDAPQETPPAPGAPAGVPAPAPGPDGAPPAGAVPPPGGAAPQ